MCSVSSSALSRYTSSQLYEVSARDPISFAAVACTLTFIAVLACWIPTRHVLSIDPGVLTASARRNYLAIQQ